MRRSKTAWTMLAIVAAAMSGPALAGPAEDASREHFGRATVAYNLGHYEQAAAEFEAAYRLVADPSYLFNIGQAFRLAGVPQKALIAYRSYLRTSPRNAPSRAQAQERVRELEALIAARQAAPTPTPQPLPAPEPPSPPRAAPPPPAFVAAAPAAPPASPDSEGPPVYKRVWFWSALAAVVAGGATAWIVTHPRTEGPLAGRTNPGVVVVK
jgi:tetratricopeptide (TPR) repeat protein